MSRCYYAPFALACMLVIVSVSASAHETWLLPESFAPSDGASIEFQMSSGMSFPAPGSAITADRIVEASLVSEGQKAALEAQGVGDGVLQLRGVAGEGLNCAWVQLHPRVLEIPEQHDVEHYLEEIGAGDAIWSHWRGEAGETLWRESYSKLARTYLRTPSDASKAICVSEAIASRFDIRPLQDPTGLKPGDSLRLSVLFDGEPLSGQAVGVVREGNKPDELRRSNAQGQLEVPLTGAGRYMIYATHLRPADARDYNWESNFVTLTIEVLDPL